VEQLAVALTALVEAQLAGRDDEVAAVLARIGQPVADVARRAGVPLSSAVAVYRRDCWTCRYCGMRTIPIPVLRVLSALHPEQLPHHPNWKAGRVHPAYLLVSTSLDHVEPGARGGRWTDESNLVCACWVCNSGKADFTLEELGWQVLDGDAAGSDWDGLTGRYAELWRAAGEPEPGYHGRWLRALAG